MLTQMTMSSHKNSDLFLKTTKQVSSPDSVCLHALFADACETEKHSISVPHCVARLAVPAGTFSCMVKWFHDKIHASRSYRAKWDVRHPGASLNAVRLARLRDSAGKPDSVPAKRARWALYARRARAKKKKLKQQAKKRLYAYDRQAEKRDKARRNEE